MAHGPKFRKIVLEIGDENAIHSGGKDSLHTRLIPPKIVDGPLLEEATLPREDPTLAPWVAWMDEIDFESLWHDDA